MRSPKAGASKKKRAALTVEIRPEQPQDFHQIRVVNEYAFGRPNEADLVEALRASTDTISLVAVIANRIVGHILFSPVQIEGDETITTVVGLGPMAVLPEHQRQGIGSQLVRAGLVACRSSGHKVIVVLGHPEYYTRFGFTAADTYGIHYRPGLAIPAFMVLELQAGSLQDLAGIVRYRPEFEALLGNGDTAV